MQDELVRDTHASLDGETVYITDVFHSSGAAADCPGDFGEPSEDINCRCFLEYALMPVQEFLASGGVLPAGLTYDAERGRITDEESLPNEAAVKHSGAVSGGLNDDNDPNETKRQQSSDRYYEEIRHRAPEREARRIVEHVRSYSTEQKFSIEDVVRIYNHVFFQEHLFADGKVKRFDSDYNMQQSFQRLSTLRATIEPHDITLLNHELEEIRVWDEHPDWTYEQAHDKAEKKYNYTLEVRAYNVSKRKTQKE